MQNVPLSRSQLQYLVDLVRDSYREEDALSEEMQRIRELFLVLHVALNLEKQVSA